MQTKKFFFLSGLQRSGATLIASILNQNPEILVTPASPLFRMMVSQIGAYDAAENVDYRVDKRITNVISSSAELFYADSKAKYIIDKNLNWQTAPGIKTIANFISDKPKIICPVRSIPEILTSFDYIINNVEGNRNNSIDARVLQETIPFGTLADRRAEWLMRYDKDIQICLNGMKLACNPELRNMFLFVEYDELVTNPEGQITKIYDFLEIEKFEHEYQNIVDMSNISENSPITGIRHLHKVRPKIEKKSLNPESVLSQEVIERYSGLEFWRSI